MNHDPAGPGLDTGEFIVPSVVEDNVVRCLGECVVRVSELTGELIHLIELRHSESHMPEGSLKPLPWTECERISCRRVKALIYREE